MSGEKRENGVSRNTIDFEKNIFTAYVEPVKKMELEREAYSPDFTENDFH